MKIRKPKLLHIRLKGKDVDSFVSAVTKIADGDTKIGFSKQALSEEEQQVIKDISNKLNEEI